jgi:hypothetical protein
MKRIMTLITILCILGSLQAQSTSCFSLYMESLGGEPGDTICLDVKARDFQSIIGLQNSFTWDPSLLSLIHVDNFNLPSLASNNFNLQPAMLSNGNTTFSWFDISNPGGTTLADGSTLFSLCFEVLAGTTGDQLPVYFSSQPTAIEIIDAATTELQLYSLISGSIVVEGNGNYPQIDSLCLEAGLCGNTKNADPTVSGGAAPYTFSWEDESGNIVANTENINAASGGLYTFTATDVNGLSASALCSMLSDDDLQLSLNYVCDNGLADITASVQSGGAAPYTFTWNTGFTETTSAGSVLAGVADSTSYSVTVTGANGCSAEQTIAVDDCSSQGNFLIAHNYECTFFNDMPTIADLSVIVWFGGVPPYTFEWSTGEITGQIGPDTPGSSITVPGNGTYFVTITDSEGTSSEYGPMELSCDNNGVNLEANVTIDCLSEDEAAVSLVVTGGIAPYSFQWSNGHTESGGISSLDTVATGSTYVVTVTDSGGNSQELPAISPNCNPSPVQFIAGDANVDAGEDFCIDITVADFIDIVGFQFSMEWDVNSLLFDEIQVSDNLLNGYNSSSFNLSNTGDGTLAVAWFNPMTTPVSLADNTVLFSLCFTAGNLSGGSEVAFTNIPTPIEVTDGQGILAYQVSNGDITVNASNGFLIAHSYACMINPGAPSTADLSVIVWTGGQPPFTFDWSTGESTNENIPNVNGSTLNVAGNGTYYVTVTDANGLEQAYGPMVLDCEIANFDLQLTESVLCDTDTSAQITVQPASGTPPYTFSWSTGGVFTDPLSSSITVFEDGIYSITVTDAVGNVDVLNAINVDCNIGGNDDFLVSHAVDCVIYPDSTEATISVVVWSGGTLPYTFDWSNGSSQVATDPSYPVGSITVPGEGSYSVTITDANGLQEVYGPISPDCGNPNEEVQLNISSEEVESGDAFCLDVSVESFSDVTSVQFSIAWDAGQISFDSLQLGNSLPGLNLTSDFNLEDTEDGQLIMSWYHPNLEQVDLLDSTVLFSMCFTADNVADTAHVVFSSVPAVIEITDGQSILPATTSNGAVINLDGLVWPGDTDTDGLVTHFDLLNIGLGYGASGPLRANASLAWEGQAAETWGISTPMSGIDYKHIDTNGDGFIEAADTLALHMNWGSVSPFNRPEQPINRHSNATIYVQPDTLVLGQENVFNIIMGQEGAPAENVYGLAFTIVYDTAAVEAGSAFASFSESWMGELNQNMLTFYQDRYEEGRIDIAITRTDGLNTTGNGSIGQLHITIQDVIFLRSEDYLMEFNIENIRLIDAQEMDVAITPEMTTSVIKNAINQTDDTQLSSPEVLVFPNPVSDILYIKSAFSIERADLLSITGEQLFEYPTSVNQISVSMLPPGTYLLRVWTSAGLSTQRITIIR